MRFPSLDAQAVYYFQDRLSKFCPADKDRPNGFEKIMFSAGASHGFDQVVEAIRQEGLLDLASWLLERKDQILQPEEN